MLNSDEACIVDSKDILHFSRNSIGQKWPFAIFVTKTVQRESSWVIYSIFLFLSRQWYILFLIKLYNFHEFGFNHAVHMWLCALHVPGVKDIERIWDYFNSLSDNMSIKLSAQHALLANINYLHPCRGRFPGVQTVRPNRVSIGQRAYWHCKHLRMQNAFASGTGPACRSRNRASTCQSPALLTPQVIGVR